ncbi:sodium:proton antiporter [Parvularcula flava]|uniref:Sodium:proton antiporter n=1 Tax=Aquisalinus luteolus TaxID=1566827 RepID=A0A8J3A2C2_9PROT|nr:Na+/H+ antiporter NhaC family protein [Aquisalinus luteolus]NHK28220.1 sodium:proton antiporter [Aquisalinus luteolus]GGH97825.1 sodium:proton antiporter [Aquisalinus luteolus]
MDAFTLLPPVMAILVAVVARNVYAALIVALFLSEALIGFGTPGGFFLFDGLVGTVDRSVAVFESSYNTQILLFCLLIGALIAFMRESGGVAAMAQALIRSGLAGSRRRAELAVAGTGTVIFIETNVSLLSAGVLGRPLYDAHGLSRERLAYIIDSTSAPISVLLLLNGWGAYALSLVGEYDFANPLNVVMGSVPWNFYALLTVTGVYLTAITGRVFGPMAKADARVAGGIEEAGPAPTRPRYMWLPLVIMIVSALSFMTITGNGNITDGDGARSILWAITLAVVVAGTMLWLDRLFTTRDLQEKAFQGIGEMVPLVTVLLLSIALGSSLRALGTGEFVAGVAAGNLPAFTVPMILFAAAALTSFMTGTSWGTYGILVPIAMPLAIALGIPPSLALAAVLGGGVFGDHCSPISDTSLIASVAAGSEHLSHVRTQLPYALVAAGIAGVMYLVAGIVAG